MANNPKLDEFKKELGSLIAYLDRLDADGKFMCQFCDRVKGKHLLADSGTHPETCKSCAKKHVLQDMAVI
jgi:hypothetical protein